MRPATIVYLNATLAAWLDHDLAQVGAGSLKLYDIVAGEGAALLTTLNAAPGEVKTEVLDLDLKTRGGKPVPVRLFHKVAYGADGVPGMSRTLVLNRGARRGQRPAARRRSALHALLSEHADGDCHRRQDRPASRAAMRVSPRRFEGLLKGEERSILTVVAERDRAALEAAIRKAAEGQSDIAPVEAALAGPGERWAEFLRIWRSRKRTATAKPPSSMRWKRRRSARWKTASISSRKWTRSANSPAASRMISTMCCPPS